MEMAISHYERRFSLIKRVFFYIGLVYFDHKFSKALHFSIYIFICPTKTPHFNSKTSRTQNNQTFTQSVNKLLHNAIFESYPTIISISFLEKLTYIHSIIIKYQVFISIEKYSGLPWNIIIPWNKHNKIYTQPETGKNRNI